MNAPRTIGELMTPCPVAVRASQSLQAAHALMREGRIRHLPVVEDGLVVGVVSQSDLRLLESLDQVDTCRVTVEEAMTHGPYVVGPTEPLSSVLDHMWKRRLGSAIVMDRGRLVGIFTAADALHALRQFLRADAADLAERNG